jgi:hypothetical protein
VTPSNICMASKVDSAHSERRRIPSRLGLPRKWRVRQPGLMEAQWQRRVINYSTIKEFKQNEKDKGRAGRAYSTCPLGQQLSGIG